VINGGAGPDMLTGRGGGDAFFFTTALGGGNIDQILDFQAGLDKMALDDAVFAGLPGGALAAGAFRSGTSAQDADDRIIYDPATGALYFDADGAGGAAQVQFATVSSGLGLGAGDFVVV
jgi:Ca2+-binding RTX toxin-like protein